MLAKRVSVSIAAMNNKMKSLAAVVFLSLVGAMLSTCSSTVSSNAITLAELKKLKAGKIPKNTEVKITLRLTEDGNTLSAPSVTTTPGQAAKVEILREFIYPDRFTLPEEVAATASKKSPTASTDGAMSFPVTPTTPCSFVMKPVGVEITLTPTIEGGFVVLAGGVVLREFAGFTRGVGEAASPIIKSHQDPVLLTENKVELAMFREASTPLYVTAVPGNRYKLTIAGNREPVELEVLCELVPDVKR
ncbi:MAG: hypothetical protein ACOYMN_03665 [Roseimicrobium sp.]